MGKLAEAYVDVTVKVDQLNAGLAGAQARLEGFASKANSLLSAVGIGLSGAAAGNFLAATAEKGSALIETMGKIKVTFGESAGVVNAMANQMADQFGAVKTTTLDAAAAFGLIAQGAGVSSRASADMAASLTRLADDASSFYNVPLAQALEKIRSGLVGEAEPLRAFGVLLSESAVKQRAMADGAKLVNGELTEQEKVMARVKIITEGLSKATGDHARTLGGYANQLRLVRGQAENFQARIGTGLSAAWAQAMVTVEDKGLMAGAGNLLRNVVLGMKGEGAYQAGADVGAGVERGLGAPPPAAGLTPFQQAVQDAARAAEKKMYEGKPFADMTGVSGLMANLGVFGGQAGIAGRLNASYMRAGLDEQIAAKGEGMRAWAGGHVTTVESFMKQAQEKLLQKEDVVAKKQLEELIKAREGIDKLVGRQEGKAMVNGMVLRGRES